MKRLFLLFSLLPCWTFAQDTVRASSTGVNIQPVLEQPQFIGNLNEYIGSHLIYPETSAEGTVNLNFIVEADGSIADIRILRGVNAALDTAAVTCVRGMPKWKPSMLNGHAIRNQMTLPIRFAMPVIEKSSQNPDTPPRVK